MQLTYLIQFSGHVIPVTSSTPNRHTRATIRIADACHDQARPIATRITLNTGIAKTRHTAASRMARDSELSLTDVQWVMGHAHLTTTEIYLTPTRDEVIEGVLAHHARQSRVQKAPPPQPAPGYDPQSLSVLFGRPS
jgi:integrase